jgi:AAA family ATP:ADP antiporter
MEAPRKSLFDKVVEFLARVEPREQRLVIVAILLLFCVFTGYGSVRPVRETFGTQLGAEATQKLWYFTALFGILAVPFYGWLVAKFRRSIVLPAIYGFMTLCLASFGWALGQSPDNAVVLRVFYVFISVMNLMTVSIFWSFLLEVFDSTQAKRLFAVIAVGGTLGAIVGPTFTRWAVAHVGHSGVMFVGAGFFTLAVILQRILMSGARSRIVAAEAAQTTERGIGGNPFAGFMQVVRSPYLFGIMLFVVGISCITTFLYFEQLEQVEKQFKDLTRRTEVFANIDTIVQVLAGLTQLFLTGRIVSRFGVTTLLVTVPLVMIGGLTWYAFTGTFIVLAIAMVIRRWGEYAFVRPGRELLFSLVDKESKYKAKNLIDVAAYRTADATFAQAKRGLEAVGVTGIKEALLVAVLAALWGINGWWLGRQYRQKAATSIAARP